MPSYQIGAPDGNTYTIDGPAGATDDQVRAEVLRQHPTAGTAAAKAPVDISATQAPLPAQAIAPPWYSSEHPLQELAKIPGKVAGDVGAVAENIAHVGSGLVAQPVSGLVGLARLPFVGADQAANDVRGVQNAITYDPHTEGGKEGQKAVQNTLGKAAQSAGDLQQRGIEAAGGGPGAVTAIPAIEQAVPALMGLRGIGGGAGAAAASDILPGATARAETAAGVTAGRINPIVELDQHGYQYRPSDVQARNPTMTDVPGSTREALTNNPAPAMTRANSATSTRLIGEDIGVPDATKLTEAHYEGAKAAPAADYDRVGSAVGVIEKANPDTIRALRAAAADTSTSAMSPGARIQAARMADGLESGKYQAGQLIKDISYLRTKGVAGTEAANSLEEELAAQVQSKAPELSGTFEKARTQFAKIYGAQDSTVGGLIDAQKYATLARNNPRMLTGNSRIVASAGNELPGVTRMPSASPGSIVPPVTAAGVLAKGGKALLKPVLNINRPSLRTELAQAAPAPGPLPTGPLQSGYVRPTQVDSLPAGGEAARLSHDVGPYTPPLERTGAPGEPLTPVQGRLPQEIGPGKVTPGATWRSQPGDPNGLTLEPQPQASLRLEPSELRPHEGRPDFELSGEAGPHTPPLVRAPGAAPHAELAPAPNPLPQTGGVGDVIAAQQRPIPGGLPMRSRQARLNLTKQIVDQVKLAQEKRGAQGGGTTAQGPRAPIADEKGPPSRGPFKGEKSKYNDKRDQQPPEGSLPQRLGDIIRNLYGDK